MSQVSIRLYTSLNRLVRQMHRFSHRVEHEQHHYREQSRLLQLIGQNEGIIQRDLTEEMDVRPSSMTEMLTKMEQLGYISRRPDEKNGRIIHIFLTEQGKLAAEESRALTEKLTEAMFDCLTENEAEQLLTLADKLCEGLDRAELNGAEGAYDPPHGSHWHHHPN